MKIKFFFLIFCNFLLHSIKKPDVNFLITNQSFASLSMPEISRKNWYLRSMTIQENYLKRIICKQLHTWPAQLLDWHGSSIISDIFLAQQILQPAKTTTEITNLTNILQQLGIPLNLLITDETVQYDCVSNQFKLLYWSNNYATTKINYK